MRRAETETVPDIVHSGSWPAGQAYIRQDVHAAQASRDVQQDKQTDQCRMEHTGMLLASRCRAEDSKSSS